LPPLAVACTSLLSTGNTLATPSSDDDAPDFRSFGGLNVCNLQLVRHRQVATECTSCRAKQEKPGQACTDNTSICAHPQARFCV